MSAAFPLLTARQASGPIISAVCSPRIRIVSLTAASRSADTSAERMYGATRSRTQRERSAAAACRSPEPDDPITRASVSHPRPAGTVPVVTANVRRSSRGPSPVRHAASMEYTIEFASSGGTGRQTEMVCFPPESQGCHLSSGAIPARSSVRRTIRLMRGPPATMTMAMAERDMFFLPTESGPGGTFPPVQLVVYWLLAGLRLGHQPLGLGLNERCEGAVGGLGHHVPR